MHCLIGFVLTRNNRVTVEYLVPHGGGNVCAVYFDVVYNVVVLVRSDERYVVYNYLFCSYVRIRKVNVDAAYCYAVAVKNAA